MSKQTTIHTLRCEIIKKHLDRIISEETIQNLEVEVEERGFLNSYTVHLVQEFLANKVASTRTVTKRLVERVPVTWWDAFKQRFFPKSEIKLRDILIEETVVVNNYNTCPHLSIPRHDRDWRTIHIKWLSGEDIAKKESEDAVSE